MSGKGKLTPRGEACLVKQGRQLSVKAARKVVDLVGGAHAGGQVAQAGLLHGIL